jgi:histidinol-phosphate aminotransferase
MKGYLKNIERKTEQEDKKQFSLNLAQNERNRYLPDEVFYNFLDSIEQEDIFFYPNTNEFREELALFLDLDQNNILLTPGSDVAIKTIFECFDLNGKNIVTSDYCFPMYKVYSEIYNCKINYAKYTGMKLNTSDILQAVDNNTQFIILANPNSPLGDYLEESTLREILNTGIYVVIDEAYIELTGKESCVPLIKEYKNLIVIKTFSKGYGAAGLRVGYAVSHEDNMNLISKLRLMYETSGISLKFCSFVLKHKQYFSNYFKESIEGKNVLVSKFLQNEFELIDTDASWFFLKRYQKDIDLLEDFNSKTINIKTIKLPISDEEYIKFNYDLELAHSEILSNLI